LGVQDNSDGLKSNGSLEVAGSGSTLTIGGALNAGVDGSGHISVQAGGVISTSGVNLGMNAGSNAGFDITDAGSQVSVAGTGNFVIGAAGSAAGEIANGAAVTADRVLLATQAGGEGAVDITGAGTVVHATHTSSEQGSGIVVGLAGRGGVQLSDGALLQSDWNMAVGGSSDGALEQTGGTAVVHGTLTLAAFAGSSGIYQMTGGLLQTDTAQINTNGELDVCGGVASIGNLVMNGGVFEICGSGGGAGGRVEIVHSSTGGAITFGTGAATLQIDDATNFHTAITNVQAGDTIDLANQQVVAETYDGSVLNLTFADNQTTSLLVSGNGNVQFDTISDGNGGSDVVVGGPGGGGGGGNAPALSIALAHDTGMSATDEITKDATLTGIGVANAVLHFTVDGTPIADTATVDANGNWTFLPSGLADGTHTIDVTESDGAGGFETAFLNFTLDITPPAVSEALANDTGVSSSDRLTNDPSLAGTGDANATVHFTIDGKPVADTAIADANGKWTFDPSGLSDGSHTIVASETDVAGNTGSASLGFTLDTTAPSAAIASDAPGKHDSFVLAGHTDAGSTVNLFDGSTALGHVTAGTNGQWSFTLDSLSQALHTFTATATDAAGNTGAVANAAIYGGNGNDLIVGTLGNDLLLRRDEFRQRRRFGFYAARQASRHPRIQPHGVCERRGRDVTCQAGRARRRYHAGRARHGHAGQYQSPSPARIGFPARLIRRACVAERAAHQLVEHLGYSAGGLQAGRGVRLIDSQGGCRPTDCQEICR
jgi:T5SS/PEP-CTERM-associated repeat protein